MSPSSHGIANHTIVYTILNIWSCNSRGTRAKADTNLRKHGISFETAAEVFADPLHIIVENDFIVDEQPYVAIGRTANQTLVALIFVDRSKSGIEVIRIISARKATAYEETLYAAQG